MLFHQDKIDSCLVTKRKFTNRSSENGCFIVLILAIVSKLLSSAVPDYTDLNLIPVKFRIGRGGG